jgi:hypothetical protein
MTLKQLQEKVSISWIGYGTYRVTIQYRGKEYSIVTHNSLAYDRIKGSDDWNSDKQVRCGYTLKQAYMALWYECKRKNDIGWY